MKPILSAAALTLLVSSSAFAQSFQIPDRIEQLSPKARETVNITLDGPLLRLASQFMGADEQEIKQIVSSLKAVHVRTFEFDRDGQFSEGDVESIRAQLRTGWSRIVVQGVTLYALAYGPGHYPQTPLPGEKGTVAMACHRTGWGSPCININQMQPGDLIYIDTTKGRYTYRVTALPRQVEKTDGWVLNGDPNSKDPYKLAITTCTPPHTSLHRLVIWADQITPAPGQPPPPVPK